MLSKIRELYINTVLFYLLATSPICITVSYVTSYFAVVCWKKNTSDPIGASFAANAGDGYRPVYWLIDETPLRPYLLKLSRSFGVEQEVEHASHQRRFASEMFR